MKLELNFTPIQQTLTQEIERQSVVVGVLNQTVKAASADYSKPVTAFSALSGSTQRRYVKTKGRSKNITLRKLAFILDAKRGIFSKVLLNKNNKELVQMAQEFAIINKTARDIRRLENIGRAFVRNPLLRKDYNPNAASTIKRKKFNHWGFQTGTLFNNIKARYQKR